MILRRFFESYNKNNSYVNLDEQLNLESTLNFSSAAGNDNVEKVKTCEKLVVRTFSVADSPGHKFYFSIRNSMTCEV
jgi:hypothetical protein